MHSRTTPRTPQAAAMPPTRILPHRKAAVNSLRRTRAILTSSTARTGSRTVKPTTKRRALGKKKHKRKQRHTKNTAADSVTAAHPSARPRLPRRTQQPASNEIIAAPLPPRKAKLESQRRTHAIYVPSGRRRPLAKTAKPPEPTQASKRRALRATRRTEPAQRLPPAAFPSQSPKSKPAPLSTRQRKPPTRLPATHPFHLFGPLVARVLRQKCTIQRIARTASRRTRRKARRRQRLAHGTRNLWRSKPSAMPISIRLGQAATNIGDNECSTARKRHAVAGPSTPVLVSPGTNTRLSEHSPSFTGQTATEWLLSCNLHVQSKCNCRKDDAVKCVFI